MVPGVEAVSYYVVGVGLEMSPRVTRIRDVFEAREHFEHYKREHPKETVYFWRVAPLPTTMIEVWRPEMKRLFVVKAQEGIKYFASKVEAKQYRDLNPGSRVQLGPDHKRRGRKHERV